MRVEGVAGRVELLFPAEYLGDKRTAFGQQFLVTLCQSPAQNGKATVTVRINKTAVSPYDDGFQLEMSPVAISNSWKTIKVIDQMLVSGGVVSSEDQLRRVLANISDITLVAVSVGTEVSNNGYEFNARFNGNNGCAHSTANSEEGKNVEPGNVLWR
ncbi:uncharacterized protein [Dysidea avara]|uniref:uncharacterized protein isoform X6 n=1 Tax=Dysidea avara TaxID=196820 RepID=UPI003323497C